MAKYCTFYRKLYVGQRIGNLSRVKWKLTHGAGQIGIYVIAEAPEKKESLAILHCANLKQPYFKEHPLHVYGIAASHAEAEELLLRISDEAIAAGRPGELKAYLDESVTENGAEEDA